MIKYIVILVIILSSCTKETEYNPDDKLNIVGEWYLQKRYPANNDIGLTYLKFDSVLFERIDYYGDSGIPFLQTGVYTIKPKSRTILIEYTNDLIIKYEYKIIDNEYLEINYINSNFETDSYKEKYIKYYR